MSNENKRNDRSLLEKLEELGKRYPNISAVDALEKAGYNSIASSCPATEQAPILSIAEQLPSVAENLPSVAGWYRITEYNMEYSKPTPRSWKPIQLK